jgi:hypothetical protein
LTIRASLRRMSRASVEVAGISIQRFVRAPGVALESLLSDVVLGFDVEGIRDFTDTSAGIGRTSRRHWPCTHVHRFATRLGPLVSKNDDRGWLTLWSVPAALDPNRFLHKEQTAHVSNLTALLTLLAVLFYALLGFLVGRARAKSGIRARRSRLSNESCAYRLIRWSGCRSSCPRFGLLRCHRR